MDIESKEKTPTLKRKARTAATAAGVKIWKTNAPTYIYHREGADSITRNLAKPL